MKFTGHNYAQAHYKRFDNGDSFLVSYTTLVCGVQDGWFWISGLYSTTTRRHIGWYLKEMNLPLTYQGAKRLCLDGCEMNIYTGEIRKG